MKQSDLHSRVQTLSLLPDAVYDQLENLSPQFATFTATSSTVEMGEEAELGWMATSGPEDLAVTLFGLYV